VAFAIAEAEQLTLLVHSTPVEAQNGATPSWTPRAAAWATESQALISVDLPGVEKSDVTVTVAGRELIVRGQRQNTAMQNDMRPLFVEQPSGAFERRFAVPPWCDTKNINARYSHGVLQLRLSRVEEKPAGEFQVTID
jgi:HSP20 family protein